MNRESTVHEIDWAAMADTLELQGETYQPVVRQALDVLETSAPHRILDIGSGPGVLACDLAARFPAAEVTAVDGAPELLARAEQRAARLGVRIRTHTAQFPDGLGDLDPADLVWAGNVVHHLGDQLGGLRLLAGLLRPGGRLAITEDGLPARWLPRDLGFGRPGLHTRLDAAQAERFAQMREELPGSVAVNEDWPQLLRSAGLTEVHSKTFLVDLPAPLADVPRRWVRAVLERSRHGLAEALDGDDLATLDRLLDPADPASVDRRPDLFLLAARTVHFGQLAAE